MRSIQIYVVLALVVSMGAIPTANAQSIEGLVMVDATGKTLGPIVNISGDLFKVPNVPFSVNNSVFVLSVFKNRFGGSGNPVNLYFNNKGCDGKTGQAVAALDEIVSKDIVRDAMFWSFVGADGGTVYVPTPDAKPLQSFKALSRLYVETNGIAECQDYPKFVPTAIPATQLQNMLTVFTPPFSVKAVSK